MLISLDTETTGKDLRHGAKPFFVTITEDGGEQTYWEWDVDPLTRQPLIPFETDLDEIQDYIERADQVVLQNPKFDVAALQTVFKGKLRWDWSKVFDTLLAGHLLASNRPHDLTSMVLMWVGEDIEPLERQLRACCDEARRMARSQLPTWRIAKAGLPEMPSAKETVWKNDTWLPRAIAQELGYPPNHPWWTVLSLYSNADSGSTLALMEAQVAEIQRRGLMSIYQERLKVLEIAYRMEARGVTLSKNSLQKLRTEYSVESERAGKTCQAIAAKLNAELTLPKSGNNKSLLEFVEKLLTHYNTATADPSKTGFQYGGGSSKAVAVKTTDKGGICLDKNALEHYLTSFPEGSDGHTFFSNLRAKRKRDTALNYMEGYEKFWKPMGGSPAFSGWYVLHPSLNPTGTNTLRWSSSNPNEQNISKQEGFNLRFMFGPAPGREWWSLDAKNIELRLPAYEAKEDELIALFEKPDDPPFYGSNHMLVFSILWPKLWEEGIKEVGLEKVASYCKKKYASTQYQWTKNGNFAVQYGAIDREDGSGTADLAYHLPGAQARVKAKFRKLEALNQHCIRFANKHGYVETMPDKNVNPGKGYPLLCTRTEYGKILETVPLNYHVQGSAMWWMMKAMIRVQPQLDVWNAQDSRGYFMVMQVHDELVFDFPRGVGSEPWKTNLPKIRKIKHLMTLGGDDLGVPTPVSSEYHADNWSEGIGL